MAQDKNGNSLSIGDKVTIRTTVRGIGSGTANIYVDTDEAMVAGGDYKTSISLASRQVELFVPPPEVPPAAKGAVEESKPPEAVPEAEIKS